VDFPSPPLDVLEELLLLSVVEELLLLSVVEELLLLSVVDVLLGLSFFAALPSPELLDWVVLISCPRIRRFG
jgi:hypothetical protein